VFTYHAFFLLFVLFCKKVEKVIPCTCQSACQAHHASRLCASRKSKKSTESIIDKGKVDVTCSPICTKNRTRDCFSQASDAFQEFTFFACHKQKKQKKHEKVNTGFS